MIGQVLSVEAAFMSPGELPMLALDVVVKAAVLLGAAAILSLLMRRKSAAVRHLAWSIAVGGVLLLPLAAGLMPRIAVPVLDGHAPMVVDAGFSVPATWQSDLAVHLPGEPASVAWSALQRPAEHSVVPSPLIEMSSAAAFSGPPPAPVWVVLLMVWATGVVVVLSRLVAEYMRVGRYAKRAMPVEDVRLLAMVEEYAWCVGLSRAPRVIQGDAFVMPMTWGLIRPVLLLPSSARSWSDQRLRAVVLHELAHIRRRDAWTQLGAQVVCALHWYNPLAWTAAKRLYVEREHACDDIVLSAGERPSAYAGELLDLVRMLRPSRTTALAAIAMARPSQLKDRLTAVLDDNRNRSEASIGLAFKFAVAGAAILIPLAALHPVQRADAIQVDGLDWHMHEAPIPTDAMLAHWPDMWAPPPPAPPPPPPGPPTPAPRAVPLPWVFAAPEEPPTPPAPVQSHAAAAAGGVTNLVSQAMQERCGTSGRNTSVSNETKAQRYTLTWRIGRCSGTVRMDGVVRFSGDFAGVASISSGGQLVVEEDDGRSDHRLIVRPTGSGLTYTYRLNGRSAEFDADAKVWFRDALELLFRRTGFAANERVDYLLQNGGPDRVLSEVREMDSNYVQRIYLQKLLERSDVSSSLVKSSLDIAARELSSDYEVAQLLIGTADRHVLDADISAAYLRAAETISSDYEKRRVLDRLLKASGTAEAAAAILRSAASIRSDYEKAQLLISLTARNMNDPALQVAYVEAAGNISSDYEHRRTLMALLKNQKLSETGLDRVLTDAPKFSSDYELAQLLVYIAENQPLNGKQTEAFRKAMDTISSKHEYGRVATALVRNQR